MRPLPIIGVALMIASAVLYYTLPVENGISLSLASEMCSFAEFTEAATGISGGQAMSDACDIVSGVVALLAAVGVAGVALLVIGIIRARRERGL